MSTAPEDEDKEASVPRKTLRLTAVELDIIGRALRRHRSAIPVYLQSMRDELEQIDAILRRLE